ncbi:MAG: hypothetical protein U5N21_09450 [Rhodococcus sp. (in: high G+C Gram-positive bacteria)]|nr:hypothetical protein [Rhodococcus sp. (in: high G+C Gram-positive bacteria)]
MAFLAEIFHILPWVWGGGKRKLRDGLPRERKELVLLELFIERESKCCNGMEGFVYLHSWNTNERCQKRRKATFDHRDRYPAAFCPDEMTAYRGRLHRGRRAGALIGSSSADPSGESGSCIIRAAASNWTRSIGMLISITAHQGWRPGQEIAW